MLDRARTIPALFASVCAAAAHAQAPAAATHSLDAAVTVADVGDACLGGDPLRAHLASWLGTDAIDARIAVVLALDDEGTPSFVVRRGDAVLAARRFDRLPPECANRRAAISLAIALAIDHTVLDRIAPTEGIAPASRDAGAGADPVAEAADGDAPAHGGGRERPTPRAAAASDVRLALGVGPMLLVGVLPEVAAGASLALEVELAGAFALRASGFATSLAGTALGRGEVTTQLVAGRLDACLIRPAWVLLVGGCVGVATGAVLAEGIGFAVSERASAAWGSVVGRVLARVPLADSVWLGLAVDGDVAFLQPHLSVRGFDGSVLTQEELPLSGVAVGLELSLGLL